jgi:hypothetical protein
VAATAISLGYTAVHPLPAKLAANFGVTGLNDVVGVAFIAAFATVGALLASLFNPLRRRVQLLVDRRFNRARYDADQTVAAFAARLKDATDLDAARHDLASVVHQALEPAHVSLWISQRDTV